MPSTSIVNRFIPFFVILALIISSNDACAQTTMVSGKVVDANTREPLPFVNVFLKGTKSGGSTDFNGNYSVSTSEKCDSIRFSYVGYNTVIKAIKWGTTQELNIGLSQGVELKAVEIKPGENPAHVILRKVIANKKKNNIEKLEAYEYEIYNKVEFDLNNISEDFKNKKLIKPFSFIFDNIDSSNSNEKPFLPVFISETMSDVFFRKNPKVHNEVIKASKVSGIENSSVSQFMGDMYQKVNLYENNVNIFNKLFVSPISDNALFYYRLYLIDSMLIDGYKCYQLQFKPRRKQELTFTGNMWIADSTFALKQIELSIADDANINFINSTAMVQTFVRVDSTWMIEKEKIVIDFNPVPVEKKKQTVMGIYGRKTTSYRNFKINQPKEEKFYSYTDNLKVEEDAGKKTKEFWNENRHDTLSKNEAEIYKMVDTLQTLPIYHTWVDIIQLFVTGYKVIGKFEYGPYYNLYSYNRIEGNRFRVGMRTSNEFSKWLELSGYVAYGLRDEQFKYKFGFRSFLSKKPRTMVGVYYKNDNEILGQSQNAFTTDNILSSIRVTPLRNLTRAKEFSTFIDYQWFQGFSTKLSFYNRELIPQQPKNTHEFEYLKLDENTGDTTVKNNITTSEIRVTTRFAYNEKFVAGEFDRASLGTKYPIFQSQYIFGVKGVLGSEYNYHKLVVNVSDRFYINPIGYTDYIIEGGKIWGALPYPLLDFPGGNQTFIYDIYAFNSMNYFEFANDKYASLTLSHHFDGFFLNKIPLMRKLKWREVVGAKGIAGSLSNKREELILFPGFLKSLNTKPYYEATIGVENIFKIFRIDGIWRLAYLDTPGVALFSVKLSMQFTF
jgi:hypothetical protein